MTQRKIVQLVATAWLLVGMAACDAPKYTIAQLQNGGIALKGRHVGLKGRVTNPDVPRTRRMVHIGEGKGSLEGFEMSDGTGRCVVWYDATRLSKPLARDDRVAVKAQVSFPAGQATGLATDMVVVAREVEVAGQL